MIYKTLSVLLQSRVALNRHDEVMKKEKMTNGWRFVLDIV